MLHAATHPGQVRYLSIGDVSDLEPFRVPSERAEAVGGVLYLDLPDGIGNSKMLASKPWCRLSAAGTVRNWNTITKLLALAES